MKRLLLLPLLCVLAVVYGQHQDSSSIQINTPTFAYSYCKNATFYAMFMIQEDERLLAFKDSNGIWHVNDAAGALEVMARTMDNVDSSIERLQDENELLKKRCDSLLGTQIIIQVGPSHQGIGEARIELDTANDSLSARIGTLPGSKIQNNYKGWMDSPFVEVQPGAVISFSDSGGIIPDTSEGYYTSHFSNIIIGGPLATADHCFFMGKFAGDILIGGSYNLVIKDSGLMNTIDTSFVFMVDFNSPMLQKYPKVKTFLRQVDRLMKENPDLRTDIPYRTAVQNHLDILMKQTTPKPVIMGTHATNWRVLPK